ncbi:MAG: GNAT family N-acetyltransferase [Candidatus Micrarchaeia archaeon]
MSSAKHFEIRNISRLDARAVAFLYKRGLAEEKPKGSCTIKWIMKHISKGLDGFGLLYRGKLIGIATFATVGSTIYMDFIYASKPRMGVGSALMLEVAKLAKKKGIKQIKASVSKIDARATAWYRACGYKRVPKTAHSRFLLDRPFLFHMAATPSMVIKLLESRKERHEIPRY